VSHQQQCVVGFLDRRPGYLESDPSWAQCNNAPALHDRERISGCQGMEIANRHVGTDRESHRVRPGSKAPIGLAPRSRRGDGAQLLTSDNGGGKPVLSGVLKCPNGNVPDVDVVRAIQEIGKTLPGKHDLAVNSAVIGVGLEQEPHPERRTARMRNQVVHHCMMWCVEATRQGSHSAAELHRTLLPPSRRSSQPAASLARVSSACVFAAISTLSSFASSDRSSTRWSPARSEAFVRSSA
jgi:hypothetical protein